MLLRILGVLCCVMLFGCQPDEGKWTVQYRIIQIGQQSGSYRVSYRINGSSEESKGPISDNWWQSEEFPGFEDGDLTELTVESTGGNGEYRMLIYVNGSITARDSLQKPRTELTLQDVI